MALSYLSLMLCSSRHAAALFTYVTNCTLPHQNATETLYFVSTPNVRGSLQIVWLCLTTLIICSYQVLHLYIKPGRRHSFVKNIGWSLLAIVAPEIILAEAAAELREARKALQRFRKSTKLGHYHIHWTLTHMLYANAYGFVLRANAEEQTIDAVMLLDAINEGLISALPPLTKDEIMDKSKDSSFTKGLAVFQILYFYIEFFTRIGEGKTITQLELSVSSIAIFSLVTYICLWYKPKSVEVPTYIEVTELLTRESHSWELRAREKVQRTFREQPLETIDPARSMSSNTAEQRVTEFNISEQAVLENMTDIQQSNNLRDHIKAGESYTEKLDVITFGVNIWHEGLEYVSMELMTIVLASIPLGAVHLAAWHFHFPSPADTWLWRLSSIICTALLPVFFLAFTLRDWCHSHYIDYWTTSRCAEIAGYSLFVFFLLYPVARIIIIVECIRCLFFLPPSAFQATSWAPSFPHFG